MIQKLDEISNFLKIKTINKNKIKEFAVLLRIGAIPVAVRGAARPSALHRPGPVEQGCREANGCDWVPHRQKG